MLLPALHTDTIWAERQEDIHQGNTRTELLPPLAVAEEKGPFTQARGTCNPRHRPAATALHLPVCTLTGSQAYILGCNHLGSFQGLQRCCYSEPHSHSDSSPARKPTVCHSCGTLLSPGWALGPVGLQMRDRCLAGSSWSPRPPDWNG